MLEGKNPLKDFRTCVDYDFSAQTSKILHKGGKLSLLLEFLKAFFA